jgi:peptide/nickel transport system substrate-binding protein
MLERRPGLGTDLVKLEKMLSRRRVLAVAGATIVSIPLLAACGGDEDEPTATTAAGQATATTGGEASPTAASEATATTEMEATTTAPADATPTEETAEPTATTQAEVTEIYGFPIEPAQNDGGTIVWGTTFIENGYYLFGTYPQAVFEALTEPHPETAEAMPRLAEGWEVSDDAQLWTFAIRQGVTFQNGEPMTVEDVVFSLTLINNVGWGSADVVAGILEAPDDETVTLTFDAPSVGIPSSLFYYGIHSQAVLSDIDVNAEYDIIANHPANTGEDLSVVIGTGPFQIVEMVSEDHETLARYEGYWGGRPHLEQIINRVMTSDLYVPNLLTGDIDLAGISTITSLNPAQIGDLDGSDIEAVTFTGDAFNGFWTNQFEDVTTMFQDVRVRQALLYAIDRQAVVEALLFGYGDVPNTTLNLPWAYDPDGITVDYPYDPELAGQLLDEAGWVMGSDGIREKDGQKFAIRGYSFAGSINELGAPIIQEFWRQVGVSVELAAEEWSIFVARMEENHDYDVIFHNITSTSVDQAGLWSCEDSVSSLRMGYCDEELDALMAAAAGETNPEARREMTTEILNYVMETLPAAPVYAPQGIVGKRTTLHNVYPNSYLFTFNVETWWIDA